MLNIRDATRGERTRRRCPVETRPVVARGEAAKPCDIESVHRISRSKNIQHLVCIGVPCYLVGHIEYGAYRDDLRDR